MHVDSKAHHNDQERLRSMIEEAWAAFNNDDPETRKGIPSASILSETNTPSMTD